MMITLKRYKKAYYLLFCALFFQSYNHLKAQELFDFEKENLKFYEQKTDILNKSLLVKRENCNTVYFSFFEEFDDTLVLVINNKVIKQWPIYNKNNSTSSSGFSEIIHGVILKKRKSKVLIKLLNKKKYIEFIVDKKFPLFSIQRYNNVWYVNARKYMMNLK